MTSRSNARQSSYGLTIQPPPPDPRPSRLTTPISQIIPQIISPRKAQLSPSPTRSHDSQISGLSIHDGLPRSRKSSFDAGHAALPSTLTTGGRKDERRLPGLSHLPFANMHLPRSPRRRGEKGEEQQYGQGAGMYDNKLVSSTLSQLPPLSPTPTGPALSSSTNTLTAGTPSIHHKSSFTTTVGGITRPLVPAVTNPASNGVVVLPNGAVLPTSMGNVDAARHDGRSIKETLVHSSPNSPWSLVTIHVLPIFAGSPLKSAVEDLNHLCHSHILATSQRTAPSRLVAVLTSDLRDFVASGMLTLKARLESADDNSLLDQLAETWRFFWTHILSYLEAVFLPFSQLQDLPSSSTAPLAQAIPVRYVLLSGFLLNILLPQLQRLSMLVSNPDIIPPDHCPSLPDLQQLLQMSLVLSTQAKYSSFFPFQPGEENDRVDLEVKDDVQAFSKALRWRIGMISSPHDEPSTSVTSPTYGVRRKASLQRVTSLTQAGRHRRPGWRSSNSFSPQPPPQTFVEGIHPSRQNSDYFQLDARWGRPRVDEEDDDETTPGQSLAPSRQDSYYGHQTPYGDPSAASTLTAGTWREGHDGHSQRTPQADLTRRVQRLDSVDVGDATPVAADPRRGQRA